MRLPLLVVMLLGAGSAATAEPRCVIEKVSSPPRKKLAAPACHRPPKAIATKVRDEITKQYDPVHDGGKAEVTFPCDGLGPTIQEIVIETGSGHGGSLSMWRAVRALDGAYDVRGVAYRDRTSKATPVTLVGGSVAAPDLDLVRAALTAKVKEVWPPPPPGTLGGFRGGSSSRDFHIVLRLTDSDGRVVERRYTGYAATSGQDVYLALEIALGALQPILVLPETGAAIADADRGLFTERFRAAVPHFDDEFYWWVMERYVDLARHLGTAAVIPGLLTRMTVTTDDRAKVDARTAAIAALATITGWDAREPKATDEEVGKRYLAACKP